MNVYFNLRGDLMCALHDFTCMLLSVTERYVEPTVQDFETNGNPVKLTAFSY